jgi:hypothetical protein
MQFCILVDINVTQNILNIFETESRSSPVEIFARERNPEIAPFGKVSSRYRPEKLQASAHGTKMLGWIL